MQTRPVARPLGWKLALGVPVAILLIRLLSLTWRLRKVNPEAVDELRRHRTAIVFAFWHGHMLPLIHAHKHENITVLVSEHKDGEIIARIARAFGFPSVRGSSTRSAVRSLLGLVRLVQQGGDAGVTPDGPRGPARSFASGVVVAAQKAGAPLVTIAAHADRAWHLRTWDSFVVPKPFATISVAYGPPRIVARDDDAEELASDFQRLLEQTCVLAGEQ
jgi:lysophospholipid acyltransferase (LPLAT)-like uncharacterized protein